jgi:hypothetical protein
VRPRSDRAQISNHQLQPTRWGGANQSRFEECAIVRLWVYPSEKTQRGKS